MRLSYESLLRGDVEAAELFGPFGNAARQNPEIRVLYDTAVQWKELTGTWPMHHALASFIDILEHSPTLPHRLIEAFALSTDFAQEHLGQLVDEFAQKHGGNANEIRKRADGSKIKDLYAWTMTHEDRQCIQAVIDLSLEYGFVDRRYSVDDIVFS